MSVRRRKLKRGWRYAYDKTIRGVRLWSPYIYLDKLTAERAESAAVDGLLNRKPIALSSGLDSSITVEGLLAERLDWLRLHGSTKHFKDMETAFPRWLAYAPHWADELAAFITVDDVREWLAAMDAYLRAQGREPGKEANKALKYFQAAWNHPWESGRLPRTFPENPFAYTPRLPVERRAKRLPTRKEVAAILLAAEGEFQLFLRILVETGARPIEARTLTWEDVGPETIILSSRKSAGGNLLPRRLKVKSSLIRALEIWRAKQGEGAIHIFQQEPGGPPRVKTWDRRNQVATCKRAKVRYFTCSCYRNFHAWQLDRVGKPLTYIRDRLGHARATTTDLYLRSLKGI